MHACASPGRWSDSPARFDSASEGGAALAVLGADAVTSFDWVSVRRKRCLRAGFPQVLPESRGEAVPCRCGGENALGMAERKLFCVAVAGSGRAARGAGCARRKASSP